MRADYFACRTFLKACTGLALWPFQSDQISVSRFASQVFGGQRDLFLRAYQHVCDRLPRGSYLYVHLRMEDGRPARALRNFLTVPLNSSARVTPGPVYDPNRAYVYEMADLNGSNPFQLAVADAATGNSEDNGDNKGEATS